MNEQLNIKVISRVKADKAFFTLEKGNAYTTKATPNTKYQLIDTATKLGPASVKVVRAGKDLRIRVYSAEELSYELILEGYSDAEGVAVIGELPDGVLYEYAGQVSDVATQIAKLPSDQELAVSLGQFPVANEDQLIAVVPVPWVATSPAVLAGIVGGAGALAGGVSGAGVSPAATPDNDGSSKVWQLIELAANGTRDGAITPTLDQYRLIGVVGIDSGPKASLLGSVIDGKTWASVDTLGEVQALADAVAAVMAGAAGGAPPTLAQLQLLGVTNVNPANLKAIQAAIAATADNGTGVDTMSELQDLINSINVDLNPGLSAISAAAQANNATETTPTTADYANAGVTGVNALNLASMNSALNSAAVDGKAVDTTAEIQALVDSYKAILAAADGADNLSAATNPSQDNYKNIGVTGVDSAPKLSLLGDVIDVKNKADVDTVPEVQALADAVQAVMAGAAGGTPPSLAQLQLLGLTGLNPEDIKKIQDAIAATNDDGTGVDTLAELQALIKPLVSTPIVDTPSTTAAQALNAISQAAENNTATEVSPDLATYNKAGVTGVTPDNLASINSALDSALVNGAAVDTLPEIQAVVDSYKAILAAADGVDNLSAATNPSQDNYKNIGVTGVDSAPKLSLLGDVIDTKTKSDVDTVPEVQALADAVAAVMAGAAGGKPPTLAQLQLLGLTGLNPANIEQIQKLIAATNDDGTGVDTLPELQALIQGIGLPRAPINYLDNVGSIQSPASTAQTTDDSTPGLNIGLGLSDTPTLYVDGFQVAASYNKTTGTLTPTTPLSEGKHDLTYTLTDAAGNESLKSNVLTVTVDTSAPAQPGSVPGTGPGVALKPTSYVDNVGSTATLIVRREIVSTM